MFVEHASGLLVPPAHQRRREVWTRDEWKLLDRTAKLLAARHVKLQLACESPDCAREPIQRLRDPADGSITLRCRCTDRVLQRVI